MSGEKWFSIDVETNGAAPGIHSLVSIGATVIYHDDPTAARLVSSDLEHPLSRPSFYAELRPHCGVVDPEAQAIHKLTPEHLEEWGQDVYEVVNGFLAWVKTTAGRMRPVFCSWGTFDWMWMGWYLERYGRRYTYPFGPNSLDLKSYYLGLTKGPEWRTTQKRNMPKGDLRGRHTHNALDDAIEQAEMVEGWIEKYGGERS
jgi:DNA polymerase III epsilon subunit-like protein